MRAIRRSPIGARGSDMRTGFRVIGWILTGLAAALLARDLFVLVQTGRWAPIDTGALWWWLHPTSLQLAEPAIARHVHPVLWDPVMLTILLSPACLVLGVPGVLLLLVTGRRRGRRSRRFGG